MLFIARFTNNPERAGLISQYYPAHVEWLKQHEDKILIPGALRAEPEAPPRRRMLDRTCRQQGRSRDSVSHRSFLGQRPAPELRDFILVREGPGRSWSGYIVFSWTILCSLLACLTTVPSS